MRFFLKYFLGLLVTLALLTWLIPSRYGMAYPARPGPQFNNAIRRGHATVIDNNKVDVVVIGDSTAERSVDETLFTRETGSATHVISTPASSTAIWYLILKNVIIDGTTHRPKYVILLFRDTLLTLPDFHVNGGHLAEVDDYATAREDFLLQTAYLNFMNPLEIAAERYLPLYGARARFSDSIEQLTRAALPRLLLGCGRDCVNRSLTVVFFNVDNVNPNVTRGFLMTEESHLYTSQAMDFDNQIGRSFLPEIIRLAKANNIQLVFVQSRALTFENPGLQPPALSEYKRRLAAYLQENGVPLLDYSFDPRLTPDLFYDPLHMTDKGQGIFTRILAKDLLDILPQP